MSKNPRVSLGLPVHNGEEYLDETLASVLNQTYPNFELVISDNASTDGTETICRAYADRDSRVRYYRNSANLGAAPNFNRVFELSSGEYFKWIAYDDPIQPDYVSKCVGVLAQNPNVVLCFTRAKIINENSKSIREAAYGADVTSPNPHIRFRNLVLGLDDIPLIPLAVFGLMRTTVAKKTSLIGRYPASDVVLIAELALYGPFSEIPEPLLLLRHHPKQSARGRLARERDRTLWFDTSQDGMIVLPKWRYLSGYLNAIAGSPVSGRVRLYCYLYVLQWSLNPRNLKSLIKDVLLAIRAGVGRVVSMGRDWFVRANCP